MKKKIKDLTLEECKKYCEDRECQKCPLGDEEGHCYYGYLEMIEAMKLIDLESEIEVDEEFERRN